MADASACYNCRYWGTAEQRRKEQPRIGFCYCYRIKSGKAEGEHDAAYVDSDDGLDAVLLTRRSFCCSLWEEDDD